MEKKKKRLIKCDVTSKFVVVTFQRFVFRHTVQYESTAWVPLRVRAPKEEWRKVEAAPSCHFRLSYFVLFYNALCDFEKKIICWIIFCHWHFNWHFTAVEMAECIVSLRGKGENYFNQLHFLALTQYVSYSVSYLPGAALQGKKEEASLLETPMNY